MSGCCCGGMIVGLFLAVLRLTARLQALVGLQAWLLGGGFVLLHQQLKSLSKSVQKVMFEVGPVIQSQDVGVVHGSFPVSGCRYQSQWGLVLRSSLVEEQGGHQTSRASLHGLLAALLCTSSSAKFGDLLKPDWMPRAQE
eukprot:CAMPEP_0202863900 /NCGR_PEP_ID=MMETSP1391-20130828/4353_1 /ASSEMBLY_ACC=CAM_ASM_000867 /TAXON_ID=1034604 /ORGANISM="Chlamydomonas leiostraca, Strain SAG 11-49" /LENGTH=139 /DNA_ID=CAMNT_0049543583 /DNA_START=755 /DNA_END=1175 /DNA_ORIENTATION=+